MLAVEVKSFIEKHIDLIDMCDMTQLYKLANERGEDICAHVADLTNALYDADIDPLAYMNKIPSHYLAGDDEFDNFEIFEPNITAIGTRAFECCYGLEKIWIPKQITDIEYSAFDCCISLSDLQFEVPSNLRRIDDFAFSSCEKLKEVILPEGLLVMGKYVFTDSGLRSLTLPASLTYIHDDAFAGLSKCKFLIKKDSLVDKWFKEHLNGEMIVEYY